MKGKVFVGWSGNRTIAEAVKKKIIKAGYECVVGGDTRADATLFLGQAILKEIDHCHQAIFLLQRKEDGLISSNAMFEFGYCLSSLEQNKIHVFYIDIPSESIPDDIKGIWATFISNVEESQIDEKVLESFLINQKKVYLENKMDIISSYYEKRQKFMIYSGNPFCSEYELAQHILFFSQSAYMHNDVEEGLKCLKHLAEEIVVRGELEQSFKFANAYLNIFVNIKTEGKNRERIYLDKKHFIEAKATFKSVLEDIEDWEESEFKLWLELLALEALNYIHILAAACPESADRRNSLYCNSIPFAEKCLQKCECLQKAEKEDQTKKEEQALSLYRAYMYRNLSTAYRNKDEKDMAAATAFLMLSYKERKKLFEHYKFKPTSARIYENFEMEYFLVLSELLDYTEDSDTFDDNVYSCQVYLEKIKQLNVDKTHYIRIIEENLNRQKGGN